MGTVAVMQRHCELFEVVTTLDPPGRLPTRLYGGQEQRDQDGDDRDHHQEFYECKTVSTPRVMPSHRGFP